MMGMRRQYRGGGKVFAIGYSCPCCIGSLGLKDKALVRRMVRRTYDIRKEEW